MQLAVWCLAAVVAVLCLEVGFQSFTQWKVRGILLAILRALSEDAIAPTHADRFPGAQRPIRGADDAIEGTEPH